jgi:monoamine oxidase
MGPVPERKTVVIVGGGFAGLAAAVKLQLAKKAFPEDEAIQALSFVVLEADPHRLGGRTETRHCGADFGAGYVGQSQNYIQFLIRILRIETEPTHLERTQRWLYHRPDAAFEVYPGDNPLEFPGVPNALYGLAAIDSMVLEVRRKLAEPWSLPLAQLWDSCSVQDYINAERTKHEESGRRDEVGMSETTERVFTASVRAAFSVEPSEISFFFLLYYAAAAGSYSALVDIAGGDGTAEGTRFKYGTADAIEKMVALVGPDNILLNQRVQSILPSERGAVVTTASGRSFEGDKVIVALSPPTSTAGIEYGPLLTGPAGLARQRVCAKMSQALGRTIKCFVHFKSAVWRRRGFMGYMLSMAEPVEQYPVGWTLDNCWVPNQVSPGDVHREPRFSLMAFIGGAAASHWSKQPLEDRARAVVGHLQRAFGLTDDDLYGPTLAEHYEERNWPVEQLGQVPAPAAMMPPGILSDPVLCRALRDPLGPVHWAGSEVALEWCGYLNGAIESGFRAMGEILESQGLVKLFQAAAEKQAKAVAALQKAEARRAPAQSGLPECLEPPESGGSLD